MKSSFLHQVFPENMIVSQAGVAAFMDAWSSAVRGNDEDLAQLVWAQDFATVLKERRASRDAEANACAQRMADNEVAPSPLDELKALAGGGSSASGSGTGGIGSGVDGVDGDAQASTASLVALRDALTAAGNDPEALAAVEAAWIAHQADATTVASESSNGSTSSSLSNFTFAAQAHANFRTGAQRTGHATPVKLQEGSASALRTAPLTVGTAVRLVGLSNAAFNGQRGTVLTGLLDGADSGRQGVQLHGSGDSIKVKRVNLLAE